MSTGGTATDQKALLGETREGQQGSSGSGQSNLSTNTAGLGKKIDGKPMLTREINGKEIDFWNNTLISADVKVLERVLSTVKSDADYDLVQYIRGIEYQGFDREFYIKHALTKMSVSLFVRFAILGALRGSNFQRIRDTCDNMPADMISAFTTCGFVKTPKKRVDITILRNTASIPHWCAYWFLMSGVTRKVTDNACPAQLQFPGAASLPMSRKIRLAHMEFCQKFSMLLPGGVFNFNIYLTAYNNQIPVNVIPQEVLALLEVASNTESYKLVDDDTTSYTKAVTKVR